MRLDPLAAARFVTEAFERLGVRYSIGGSMASTFAGEPRSTLDVDLVADLSEAQIDQFLQLLGDEFYVEANALHRAVVQRTSVNVIHSASSVKIDIFVAGGTPLDEALLQRRRRIVAGEPSWELYVHSPEDILLQKLRWFRLGGEVSDRQWRDVLGIIRVQRDRLDDDYLDRGAGLLGVEDLLDRARGSATDGEV
jgi:hypothetical protein